jgi:hypothetical protein
MDKESLKKRIDQLIELHATQRMAFDKMENNQEKIKGTFNCKAGKRDFKKGDQVLMWDKRRRKHGMHKNFDILLFRPYMVE